MKTSKFKTPRKQKTDDLIVMDDLDISVSMDTSSGRINDQRPQGMYLKQRKKEESAGDKTRPATVVVEA